MKNNLPIKLTSDLRINDYDDRQYVIERKSLNKNTGAEVWSAVDYVQAVNALSTIARRRHGDIYAGLARKRAGVDFDAAFEKQILALPAKKGKTK